MENAWMKEKWEVEYARFLNFPPIEATDAIATAVASAQLKSRRITKSGKKESGTWLTASSLASLKLVVDWCNADVILRVQYRGRVLEEHFISKLNFSWPQVACISGYPPRGTRVLVATYKDGMDEVQKFSLRFSIICDIQAFMNALKVGLEDAKSKSRSNSKNRSNVSSPRVYRPTVDFVLRTPQTPISPLLPLASSSPQDKGSCLRKLVEVSHINSRSDLTSEIPHQPAAVQVVSQEKTRKESTVAPPSIFKPHSSIAARRGYNSQWYPEAQGEEISGPKSMTLMMARESTHSDQRAIKSRTDQQENNVEENSQCRIRTSPNSKTDETSHSQFPVPSNSADDTPKDLAAYPPSFTTLLSNCLSITEQASAPQSGQSEEDDLKNQIARFMEDSNFQDMLMKVEKVIGELGYVDAVDGDLF